jgi:hypothetical protein
MAAKKKSAGRKTTAKKTASKSSRKQSPGARKKVSKVMHEYKRGELKSGGRRKVKNPKQAIAIALSEARESGENVPPPKKKSARKKSASKKSTQTSGTQSAGRKSSSKK